MPMKKKDKLSVLALFLAMFVAIPPVPLAAQASTDSEEVSTLLAEANREAKELKSDTEEMQTFTRSNLNWKTFGSKITEIKRHVNNIGETVGKLNNARSGGSAWQQQAIDRINPLLKELASSVGTTISQLNEHQGLVHSTHYKEYVQANHDQASTLAALVSDFVEYGKTKNKMEELAKNP
jgi:methyl-accepting chemotaxis protein